MAFQFLAGRSHCLSAHVVYFSRSFLGPEEEQQQDWHDAMAILIMFMPNIPCWLADLVGAGNKMPNSEDTKIVSSSRQFNAMSASKLSCVGRPKKVWELIK